MRLAHTYSCVAFDPALRQWGVAVQTHWFGVGAAVAWAEGSVGAVATQSLTDPSYGPLGLSLMRAGKTAPEALRALLAADARAEVRQVAMIDGSGKVAAHTGEKCIGMAGHHVGENYSVQANLMLRSTVWEAMAVAFEAAHGDLAERMLASLQAAEDEGGDIRGRQSACLVVVTAEHPGRPWSRLHDVRVDDHPQPLSELRRLVAVSCLYDRLERATEALEATPITEARLAKGREEFALVRQGLPQIPGNAEPIVWYAVGLANAGRLGEALPLFAEAFRMDSAWREIVPRLVQAELLTVTPEEVRSIQEV